MVNIRKPKNALKFNKPASWWGSTWREAVPTGNGTIGAAVYGGAGDDVIMLNHRDLWWQGHVGVLQDVADKLASVRKKMDENDPVAAQGILSGALITKNEQVRANVMKWCQARLSPPLVGQIAAEASLDTPEEYMLEVYNEYVERRKFLIDGLNRIPGCYSPIPMGAFYTLAKLPVDDADKFCAWCLEHFEYEGQTVFMAPASGFYTDPELGRNQVRIAYVLKKEELEKALIVLAKAVEAYPGRML